MFDGNNGNSIKTIGILMCKQISSNSFKNKIAFKLFTYISYRHIHLIVCKQMTDVTLLCYIAILENIKQCTKKMSAGWYKNQPTKWAYKSCTFDIWVKTEFGIK